MNARLGWGLALAALALGGALWGWRGLALAASAVAFWLLMQLSRAMRVMRRAAQAPVGEVPNAVMLNAKLAAGMTMLEVLAITRSLGRAVGPPEDETWCWLDAGAGADLVQLRFTGGRLLHWELQRAASLPGGEPGGEPAREAPQPLSPPGGGAT